MTETKAPDEPATPDIVHKSRRIPTVWLVPFVAALIGGWLAVKHFREAGIPIEISFKTAAGIQEGKTVIKYKDIQVGVVDSVDFSEDVSHVTVNATMERAAEMHLKEQNKFWVVEPRIGPSGISGLGTIISGPYIDMSLGGGEATTKFVGLEEPPVASADVKGLRLVLQADELGSIHPGMQIFFRDIRAGEVQRYRLKEDGTGVEVEVLVEAPFDKFVLTTSHFWNASAVNVTLDSDGLTIATESLSRILAGSLAFDSPDEGDPAKNGGVFQIHASHAAATQLLSPEKGPFYVLYPPSAAGGLGVGANVALEGVAIGDVTEVKMEYDPAFGIRTRVQVRLEPTNIHGVHASSPESVSAMMKVLVESGLRAQLKRSSLLTGELYVDLGFHPDEPVQLIGGGEYPELPAIHSPLDSLEKKIVGLIERLADLPLEGLIEDTRGTIVALRETTEKIGGQVDPLVGRFEGVADKAEETMTAATGAIQTIEAGVAPDSAVYFNLATALEELSAAARSIRLLTAFLERNPNALLRGKSKSGGN